MRLKLFCNFKIMALCILMCLSVLKLYAQDKSEVSSPQKMLAVGEKVQNFLLQDAVSKNKFQYPSEGKWNIILYWSLFCRSCIKEIPRFVKALKNLDADPSNKDTSVFFVSIDTSRMEKGLKNFALKRKIKCPILMEEIVDGHYLTADKMGVSTTPALFVVDPEGKIAYSHVGPFDVECFFELFYNLKKTEDSKINNKAENNE